MSRPPGSNQYILAAKLCQGYIDWTLLVVQPIGSKKRYIIIIIVVAVVVVVIIVIIPIISIID